MCCTSLSKTSDPDTPSGLKSTGTNDPGPLINSSLKHLLLASSKLNAPFFYTQLIQRNIMTNTTRHLALLCASIPSYYASVAFAYTDRVGELHTS